MSAAAEELVPPPTSRRLRIFAFDPGIWSEYHLADISEVTVDVRWEDKLDPGPVGEYIEVVDRDPASKAWYRPVDLNDRYVLAQNGLAPSETNPQFHQQMVYAVAMATINHFEQALGRVALWSSHREFDSHRDDLFVRRLRIYPHALRERNAYYSPDKKALLFGYFPVKTSSQDNVPGTIVFSCLSHDIVAHETTHALLDGVHPRFNLPFNVDVLAFHEAFADLVAMLQKFAYPGVLRKLIAQSRGNLASENLLGQLAQQFGRASGRGNALRDAIGYIDKATKVWHAYDPDPRAYQQTKEPHARGAILVAAIFGVLLKVYRSRTADLFRLATDGTGVLKDGDIHPDLSNRLADEAADTAKYILRMCIRAIDYCPPFDLSFGDYLRAVITGDVDLNPDDPFGYRRAFIDCFRQWGIYPKGMRSMSVEALLWPNLSRAAAETKVEMAAEARERSAATLFSYHSSAADREQADTPSKKAWMTDSLAINTNLESDRYETWVTAEKNALVMWSWLVKGPGKELASALGIVLAPDTKPTVFRSQRSNDPAVEIHSARPAMRRNTRGDLVRHLVVEITQRRRGYFDVNQQQALDDSGVTQFPDPDFIYRAGCTVLFDPTSKTNPIMRVIRTPGTIDDDDHLDRVRRFLSGDGLEGPNAFDSPRALANHREPFAVLHRGEGGDDHG